MMKIKKTMAILAALMMVLCMSFAAAADESLIVPAEKKDATVIFLRNNGVIEAIDANMNERLGEFEESEELLAAEQLINEGFEELELELEEELEELEEKPEEEPEEELEEKPEEEPEEELEENPEELEEKPEEEPTEIEEPEEAPAMLTDAALSAVNRSVTITVRCGSTINEGDKITLVSHLEGYEGCKVMYQWQCDSGNGFEDIPGANGATYTFEANQESIKCSFRVLVDAE